MRIEICEVVDKGMGMNITQVSERKVIHQHCDAVKIGLVTDDLNHVLPKGYVVSSILVLTMLGLVRIYICKPTETK